MRTVLTYFDIDRGRWCNDDASPLPGRQYPIFYLWETICIVLHLINSRGEPIPILEGGRFNLLVTNAEDSILLTPDPTKVNNIEDYEDISYEDGIISFGIPVNTEEAVAELDYVRTAKAFLNVSIEQDNTAFSFAAPIHLYKVVRKDETPIPVMNNSQYRINPLDSGTDIWDYGQGKWMRPSLFNGILSYYEAP